MPELFFTAIKRLLATLVASFVYGHAAAVGLSFGILDACQPLRDAIAKLQRSTATPLNCRPPRTDLERQYFTRLAVRGQKLCFLPTSTLSLLAPFSCMQQLTVNGAQIICFRPASLVEVKAYKNDYSERHAFSERQYLDSAAACPDSTGDAARAGPTLFPTVLGELAAFELGFITVMRSAGVASATAVHGYAETDPQLQGDIPSAVEFVSLNYSTGTGAPVLDATETSQQVGDWLLETDDEKALEKDFAKVVQNSPAAMRVFSVGFSFSKRGSHATADEKALLLRGLKRTVISQLRGEGFRLLSSKTLERLTGMSKPFIFEAIRKNLPYNRRKTQVLNQFDFEMLIHEHLPTCDPLNPGEVMANILNTAAEPGVRSDHGSISIMVLVVGSCALQPSLQRYAEALQMQVEAALVENLKRR